MKYLAIDYGQKRTGIAVSDTGGSMAFPRKTILMRTRAAFLRNCSPSLRPKPRTPSS